MVSIAAWPPQPCKANTNTPPPDRGFWNSFWGSLFGYSERYRLEDHQHHVQQIISKERARREAERKRVEKELEQARQKEASLHAEIEQAVIDLSLNEDKLADAKANLAKANSDLKRLGNQELELVRFHHTLQRKDCGKAS